VALVRVCGNKRKRSQVRSPVRESCKNNIREGVPFLVLAGMVLLLIKKLKIIYKNITNQYNNNY
jgi:hypothetical protein